MKLSEIRNLIISTKTINNIIIEGRVDPNILLSIRNIVRDGKATDNFQYLMLYRIIEMLKYGQFYKESNFFKPSDSKNKVSIPSQKEIIDLLRSLSPEEITLLATKFFNLLSLKNTNQIDQLINIEQSASDWIAYVISKEAADW